MGMMKVFVMSVCVLFFMKVPVAAQTILDDFESGKKAANKMGGIWYTFNDNKSTTTPGASHDSIYFGSTDTYGPQSTKSLNVQFSLYDTLSSPYCGFGTYLNAGKICGDISAYAGLTFHFKGPLKPNVAVWLRIEDSTTIAANPPPLKSSFYYVPVTYTKIDSSWDSMTVAFSSFGFSMYAGTTPPPNGMDLKRVAKISFQFKGIQGMAPDTDQFFLDDVILETTIASGVSRAFGTNGSHSRISIVPVNSRAMAVSGITEPSMVTISDCAGRIVATLSVRKNGRFEIKTMLRAGTYLATVRNERQYFSGKLTIAQ